MGKEGRMKAARSSRTGTMVCRQKTMFILVRPLEQRGGVVGLLVRRTRGRNPLPQWIELHIDKWQYNKLGVEKYRKSSR